MPPDAPSYAERKAKREAKSAARELKLMQLPGPNGAEAGSWARALQVFLPDEDGDDDLDDDDLVGDDGYSWFPPDGNDDVEPPPPPPPPPPAAGHAIAV